MASNPFDKFPKVYVVLFLFFVTLLSAFGDQLLPPSILKVLSENRAAQLVAAYFLVVFTLEGLILAGDSSLWSSLVYGFLVFVAYIVISKQTNLTFIISVVLLGINYMLYKQILIWNTEKAKAPASSLDEYTDKIDKLKLVQKIIGIITVVFIAFGVALYFRKEYKDHGEKSSNIFQFILKFFLEGSNLTYDKQARIFSDYEKATTVQ
tara:strand:- start:961 stop:1584 length:624 start_codon:yes stop_codon:yes gene_type:complete